MAVLVVEDNPSVASLLQRGLERDGYSVDVAVAWGPLAGYFAKRSPVRLELTPVTPATREFAFSMAMGVRHGDSTTRAVLETELARRHADIRRILEDYGVPLVETSQR